MRDNQVHIGANQFSRQFGKSFVAPLRPAVLDGDVRALDITEIAQTLPECLDTGGERRWGCQAPGIRSPALQAAAHAQRVAMRQPRHQAER